MEASARWMSISFFVLSACSPREVHGGADAATSSDEPASAPALLAPGVIPTGSERRTPVRPSSGAPADLAAFLGLLRAAGEGCPALVLGPAELEQLFAPSEDPAPAVACANHLALDLLGDARCEQVVAISAGWWGNWLELCVFEDEAEAWRLVLRRRIDGPCRGVPALATLALGSRRWLQVSAIGNWGTGIQESTVTLLEPSEGQLVPVLRAATNGWLAGWGQPLSVEFASEALTVEPAASVATATLALKIKAFPELELPDDSALEFEARFVFEQASRAAPFRLTDPPAAEAADLALVVSLASEAWLTRNIELACQLAERGTPDQRKALALLLNPRLVASSPLEAGRLASLLPPTGAESSSESQAPAR